jgi:hypothetical protein
LSRKQRQLHTLDVSISEFSPTYILCGIFPIIIMNSLADIQLMDENIFVDEKLGKSTINLNSLNLVNGEVRPIQVSFGNVRFKKSSKVRKIILDLF